MSKFADKAIAHERRRAGESALSDFADYVEQQQARRRQQQQQQQQPATTAAAAAVPQEHDELDILETLGLADEAETVKLKELLLEESAREGLKELLRTRIEEGRGECLFDVGTENNGESMGLSREEYAAALVAVRAAAKELRAGVTVLMTKNVGEPATDVETTTSNDVSAKVMVRRQPESVDELLEIRVAVVGNVDAGKSTLLGVLTKGTLDDGRGRTRVNLFRHKHEIESGRTSSVGMEILGYDVDSNIVVSGDPGRKLKWEEIGHRSAKVIGFTDLAGHERYLRTTVFGLLGTSPDYVMLMVAANNGLIGMSKEHLGIAMALNVPVLVVITKIDICPPQILQQTITQLTKILKSPGARKIPIFIKSKEEVINTATQFVSERICPIFQVSNVTGEGLDYVRTFLNILPFHGKFDSTAPFEFHVNDCFSVPFVGTVVSGVVKSGVIHAGDSILIGPDSLGNFTPTVIRSIERKRLPVPVCSAGQSASFALKRVRRKDVRKGMVVLPKQEGVTPKAFWQFTAEVLILSHATTIKPKYQAMLHVGPVSQTCRIVAIDRDLMRTGDRASVVFEFCQRPEFLCAGDKLLFREGRTKGLGIVTATGFDKNKFPNAMTEERDVKASMAEEKKGGGSKAAASSAATVKAAEPKAPATKTGAAAGAAKNEAKGAKT
ncbi:P-loop containing nucleoside triphosphate hydrolase protein [Sphaerosporella brunnea]|uniref:P-loop containing nucleoside triphosphate hydrolase protein n=1 Tax=Sphaerosporella brunnea TaxID=1250544 RepID=A0A5J5ESF6_9PEZI|nr:P-loop containing nucleoside triphosphate hydrolase protein [Sphaerosporella brunnea]